MNCFISAWTAYESSTSSSVAWRASLLISYWALPIYPCYLTRVRLKLQVQNVYSIKLEENSRTIGCYFIAMKNYARVWTRFIQQNGSTLIINSLTITSHHHYQPSSTIINQYHSHYQWSLPIIKHHLPPSTIIKNQQLWLFIDQGKYSHHPWPFGGSLATFTMMVDEPLSRTITFECLIVVDDGSYWRVIYPAGRRSPAVINHDKCI